MNADASGEYVSRARRIASAAATGRFSLLFWLLVAAIAAPVVIPDGPIVRLVIAGALFFVMLAGLRAISNHRGQLIAGVILSVPAVVLNTLGIGLNVKVAYLVSLFLYLLFFGYLAFLILLHTLKQHDVDAQTIYAAVDVYLLFGLFWTMAYYAIALMSPGSFHFPESDPLGRIQAERTVDYDLGDVEAAGYANWQEAHQAASGTLMYYSFVTLTTLGYGDIHPVNDTARVVAMLEAMFGQLYLVILVARLVGLYTSQEQERRRKATPT